MADQSKRASGSENIFQETGSLNSLNLGLALDIIYKVWKSFKSLTFIFSKNLKLAKMTKMYLEEGSDIDLDDIEISEEVENEIWQNIQLNREMQKLERKVSFIDTANSGPVS